MELPRLRGEGMTKVRKVAVLLGMAIWSVAVLAQTSTGTTSEKGGDNPSGAQGSGAPADYLIGADDTLHISVWKEPDLSETLPVRPDGKISMPLLGDVEAAGLTPTALGDSIKEKLKK